MNLAPNSKRSRARILLVEDDLAVRASLESILLDDYDVLSVSTVQAALARLASKEFDVVLSDYNLPGDNGAALVAKAHERCPEVMFLLLTGHPQEAARDTEAFKDQIHVIAKPCDPGALLRWVSRAATLSSVRRAALRMRNRTSGLITKVSSRDSGHTLWVVVLESEGSPRDTQNAALEDAPPMHGFDRVSIVEARDREACLLQISGVWPDALVADGDRLGPNMAEWLKRLRSLSAGRDLPVLLTRVPVGERMDFDRLVYRVSRPATLDVLASVVAPMKKSDPPR